MNVQTIQMHFLERAQLYITHHLQVCVGLLIMGVQFATLLMAAVNVFPDTGTYCNFIFFDWHSWIASSRPFVYPLVIYLMHHNFGAVVFIQYCISTAAMLVLCWSGIGYFNHSRAKLMFAFLMLCYLLSPGVLSWNACVLSDSITFSLWFLFFAFMIQYVRFQKMRFIGYTMITAVLLIFIRYFDLVLVGCLLPLFAMILIRCKVKKSHLMAFIVSGSIVCAVGFGALMFSDSTNYSLKNIISVRVMSQKDASILHSFTQAGFPIDATKGLNFETDPYVVSHHTPTEIEQWVAQKGHSVYVNYLLTHPYYVFIMPLLQSNINHEFSRHKKAGSSIMRVLLASFHVHYHQNNLLSYNSFYIFLVVLIAVIMNKKKIGVFQKGLMYFKIALYLFFATILATGLIWHLEPMEMGRHAMFSTFFSLLGFILVVCKFFDNKTLHNRH